MVTRNPYGKWGQAWTALRGPIAFGLGALIMLTELVNALAGRGITPEFLIVAAGLCGVPAFLPPMHG